MGLAYSRNLAIARCRTRYGVFIDDEVSLPAYGLARIREEFGKGYQIVGVHISGPEGGIRLPWYIRQGQLHYLGIHPTNMNGASTWGVYSFSKSGQFSSVNKE